MTRTSSVDRRSVLRSTGGALAAGLLAGCGGDGGGGTDDNTVIVGRDNKLQFEPAELTIETGETVTWEFESPTHNVCGWPAMDDNISIPEGASGFGSMPEDGDPGATVSTGESYEHTFETAGTYEYLCYPHRPNMAGTIVVE